MTCSGTKRVVHNVFGSAFTNVTKTTVLTEGRERNPTCVGRQSIGQSNIRSVTPSWKRYPAHRTTANCANMSSQAPTRPIIKSKLRSPRATPSKIPRSPSPPQSSNGTMNNDPQSTPSVRWALSASTTSLGKVIPIVTRSDNKVTATEKPKASRSGSNNHPHYVTFHLGEPCTVGALDHLLTCGHKIMTTHPENCASNCNQQDPQHTNPRSLDQAFTCMACIVEQIKKEHAEKVLSFCAALEAVAGTIGKADAANWMKEKVTIMEIAWRDLELDQMREKAATGRSCHAFYVGEDYQDMVNEVLTSRNGPIQDPKPSSSALPSSERPEKEVCKTPKNNSTSTSKEHSQPSAPTCSTPNPKKPSRLPVPLKLLE